MSSQARVLSFVQTYFSEHGLAPSVREISEGVSLAPSTVHRLLDQLDGHGELIRLRGVARGLLVDVDDWRTTAIERDEYLNELATSFEYAAAHEAEFIPDDHEIGEPVRHALNAAAFKGAALGIRAARDLTGD